MQDSISGNRFKDSLESTDGLAARYLFTAANIQEGKADANGLKKVFGILMVSICQIHG